MDESTSAAPSLACRIFAAWDETAVAAAMFHFTTGKQRQVGRVIHSTSGCCHLTDLGAQADGDVMLAGPSTAT
jgi:hypothetical protein